jgi:hypothetical protein
MLKACQALLFLAGVSVFNGVHAENCSLLPDEAMTSSLSSTNSGETRAAPHRLQGETFSVTYRLAPSSPAIGEHFKVFGRVCRNDGAGFAGSVKVGATMPRHGHGMNYVPSSEMFDNGQFVASGMLLHMPGQWAVELNVVDGASRERLQFEYQANR